MNGFRSFTTHRVRFALPSLSSSAEHFLNKERLFSDSRLFIDVAPIRKRIEREHEQKRQRSEEREDVEHFNFPPRFIVSDLEVDSGLAMADHYADFLGRDHKPNFFITIASEKPCSIDELQQASDLIVERWIRATTQHGRGYKVWNIQPIRQLKGSKSKHPHIHRMLSTTKKLTRDNVRKWTFELQRAIKYAESRSRKARKENSRKTSRKNGEVFSDPTYMNWSNLKLNVVVYRVKEDSRKAGLYTIQNHRDLTIHEVVCSHAENSCRGIEYELKKGKKVCGRRVCRFNRTDENKPTETHNKKDKLIRQPRPRD